MTPATIHMEDFQAIAARLEGRSFNPPQRVIRHRTLSSRAPGCAWFDGADQCCSEVVEELVFNSNSEPDWGLPVCSIHLAGYVRSQLLAALPSDSEEGS